MQNHLLLAKSIKVNCVLIKMNFHKLYSKSTVKLGYKERFDKEQIGIKEPIPVTNLPFAS